MKLSHFSSLVLLAVSGAFLTVSGCVPGAVDLGGPNEADSGSSDSGQLDAGMASPDSASPDSGTQDSGIPDSGNVLDSGSDGALPIGDGAASTSCVSTPVASTPLASQLVPSSTESTFRALIVGQWVQYEGLCLETNVIGEEFLADGTMYKLTRLGDGTIQRLASAGTWSLVLDDAGEPMHFMNDGTQDSPPVFFDSGSKMHALFSPWYTNLQRVP